MRRGFFGARPGGRRGASGGTDPAHAFRAPNAPAPQRAGQPRGPPPSGVSRSCTSWPPVPPCSAPTPGRIPARSEPVSEPIRIGAAEARWGRTTFSSQCSSQGRREPTPDEMSSVLATCVDEEFPARRGPRPRPAQHGRAALAGAEARQPRGGYGPPRRARGGSAPASTRPTPGAGAPRGPVTPGRPDGWRSGPAPAGPAPDRLRRPIGRADAPARRSDGDPGARLYVTDPVFARRLNDACRASLPR